EGRDAAFEADDGAREPRGVWGDAHNRCVAAPLGETRGGAGVANQSQLGFGVLLRPAALKRGRVPAERSPSVAEGQLAMLFSRKRVQLLGICEDPPGLRQESLAEGGGLATVPAAVQHALAERLFQ